MQMRIITIIGITHGAHAGNPGQGLENRWPEILFGGYGSCRETNLIAGGWCGR